MQHLPADHGDEVYSWPCPLYSLRWLCRGAEGMQGTLAPSLPSCTFSDRAAGAVVRRGLGLVHIREGSQWGALAQFRAIKVKTNMVNCFWKHIIHPCNWNKIGVMWSLLLISDFPGKDHSGCFQFWLHKKQASHYPSIQKLCSRSTTRAWIWLFRENKTRLHYIPLSCSLAHSQKYNTCHHSLPIPLDKKVSPSAK